MDPIDEHRLSFGAVAQAYQQTRPTYPAEALAWAIGTAPGRVVDLGAGTGQLTRVALAAGFAVVPVEPDPAMRAALDAATPGTVAREGSAESIPLPDGYADAVVVGTAYHWFDKERAHPEIARVLRAGGVFAPMRNDRDLSVDWVRQLDAIVQAARFHRPDEVDFGPLFAPAEWATFRHAVTQTPQGLLELIATRSWYLVAAEDLRQRLRDQVTELCATHPDLAGRDTFELPYVTTVCRTVRR
ncbi:class I SAM-dependent methyltransferase [Catellatospora aurea]|uniref:Class I SAM-dependent methyltransferase n=1 Tax=Catellatospora aurea TaxID=1337874 RepID=A0ABW2GXI8_9ACTN